MKIPNIMHSLQSEEFSITIEDLQAPSHYNTQSPHRHDYYELFFFKRGGGFHIIDFKKIPIRDNDIHLVRPNQVHTIELDSSAEGFVIKFPVEYLLCQSNLNSLSFLEELPDIATQVLSPKVFTKNWNLLLDMQSEKGKKAQHYECLIKFYLGQLLVHTIRNFPSEYPSKIQHSHKQLVFNFKQTLEAYFQTEQRVSFYAQQLLVSSDKLNSILKKHKGLTASQLINQRRLLEAKRYLLHENLNMKNIAYSLDFNDPAYFNRWFKKLAGYSPGEFQRIYSQKYKN